MKKMYRSYSEPAGQEVRVRPPRRASQLLGVDVVGVSQGRKKRPLSPRGSEVDGALVQSGDDVVDVPVHGGGGGARADEERCDEGDGQEREDPGSDGHRRENAVAAPTPLTRCRPHVRCGRDWNQVGTNWRPLDPSRWGNLIRTLHDVSFEVEPKLFPCLWFSPTGKVSRYSPAPGTYK